MSRQHLQGDGAAPASAEWRPVGAPETVHPAAFEAWAHASNRAVLLKFWFCDGWRGSRDPGSWEYQVIAFGQETKTVYVAGPSGPVEPAQPLVSASSWVRRIEQAKGA